MPGPSGRAGQSSGRGRVRLEPGRPFPARLFTETGAELDQAVIGGGDAKRSPGLALLVWIMDVVVGRVDLDSAHQRVIAIPIGRAEAAKVHLPEVEAGLAVDDPLGHRPAHPAGARDPMGAETGRDIKPTKARLAKHEFVVGR